MASDIKIKINTSEITFLIQTTGTSLRDINNQLEKLKLFAYPNDLITSDMVKKVANSNVDITTAVDYILSKNYIKALDIISEAIQKDHYLSSLALIQTTISNLLRTKIYSKTMNSSEIARKLNQLEFIAGKNVEKLSKISEEFLINLKINLLKAEFCLKTGILKDPITAYEMAFAGNFEGIEL